MDEKSKKRGGFVLRLSELGMTQEAFARTVGVSLLTVNRWVSGKQCPKLSPRRTLMICNALSWSLEELAEAFPDDTETESA
jgi:DNA-binding XRE family transcriptional regulator